MLPLGIAVHGGSVDAATIGLESAAGTLNSPAEAGQGQTGDDEQPGTVSDATMTNANHARRAIARSGTARRYARRSTSGVRGANAARTASRASTMIVKMPRTVPSGRCRQLSAAVTKQNVRR